MRALNAVLLLFLLFWSALTLMFDGRILQDFAHQSLATRYPRASGTITHSRVVQHRGNKGSTYGFEVRYAYEVEGRGYEGTRYRYGSWNPSDREVADDAARRFPVGASVSVFHHPETPADAVLLPGVQGHDVFMLLFMSPFNLVMLAGWYAVLYVLRSKEEDDGVGAFTRDGRVHVRLEGMSARAAGLVAFGVASVVALFAVGLVTSFNPSLPTAVLTWGAVIAVGVFFARRQRAKLDAGDYDLILDEMNQRLSLPAVLDREERLEVPWSQVKSVIVEARTKKDKDGDHPMTVWCPTLVLTTPQGEDRNEALVEWEEENKATLLVKWLRARLRHGEPAKKERRSG
jgi:Protein of unknown function (DUF3592)